MIYSLRVRHYWAMFRPQVLIFQVFAEIRYFCLVAHIIFQMWLPLDCHMNSVWPWSALYMQKKTRRYRQHAVFTKVKGWCYSCQWNYDKVITSIWSSWVLSAPAQKCDTTFWGRSLLWPNMKAGLVWIRKKSLIKKKKKIIFTLLHI